MNVEVFHQKFIPNENIPASAKTRSGQNHGNVIIAAMAGQIRMMTSEPVEICFF
jgi:hypothetical protein